MPRPEFGSFNGEKKSDSLGAATEWDTVKEIPFAGEDNTEYILDESDFDPRPPELRTEQGLSSSTMNQVTSPKSWKEESEELLALAKEISRQKANSAQAEQPVERKTTLSNQEIDDLMQQYDFRKASRSIAAADEKLRQDVLGIGRVAEAERAETERLSNMINGQPQQPQQPQQPTQSAPTQKGGFFSRFRRGN